MDKKEFEKLMVGFFRTDNLNEIDRWRKSVDRAWQCIEQYGKEQRVDELNREELDDNCGWYDDFQNYKENRIKELKDV